MYVGEIGHKGNRYPGQHKAIVDPELFERVQAILQNNRRKAVGTGNAASPMLSGLVIDPAGARMTATHTGKGAKRYRYYASPALRLPAGELEELVSTTLVDTLGTPAKLAGILPDLALLTADLIASADRHARQISLAQANGDLRQAILDLVARVQLTADAVITTINLAALGAAGTASITTPATIAKPKARLSLVVPGSMASKPDRPLIGIVAQARLWVSHLTSGECTTVAAVAARHHVPESYVRKFIGAAFLAPDLVTRIVEGRQPYWLTRDRLTAMLPLPTDWNDQRRLFAQQN